MYCPSCSAALPQELSYCNRCGANLGIIKGSGKSKSSGMSVESMVWAIVAITATVLVFMIPLIALMKEAGLSGSVIASFVALMLLILIGIDGVFVWQLIRLNGRDKEAGSASQLERSDTKELGAQREQALPEPRISVTEDTTRMFEPTYEERRTK